MTKQGFINSVEALEALGLYNPASGKKPNTKHLNSLHKRGLLKRWKVGSRTILYKMSGCLELFEKATSEGINLTDKPL